MKKIYLALFSLLLIFTSCKKDRPDSFANLPARKTWQLYDYQYRTYLNPSFLSGYSSFSANGRVEYTDTSGHVYKVAGAIRIMTTPKNAPSTLT
jgi:hypothetical protein